MKSKRIRELKRFGVQTTEELERKCAGYFDGCEELGSAPTLLGLCRALGVSREELLFYEFDEEIGLVLARAKTAVEAALEEELIKNPKNASAIIFLLKVNFGWGEDEKTKTGDDTLVVELGK